MRGAIDTVATWSELEEIEAYSRDLATCGSWRCEDMRNKWVEQFQSGRRQLFTQAHQRSLNLCSKNMKIILTELFARYTNNPGVENAPNNGSFLDYASTTNN